MKNSITTINECNETIFSIASDIIYKLSSNLLYAGTYEGEDVEYYVAHPFEIDSGLYYFAINASNKRKPFYFKDLNKVATAINDQYGNGATFSGYKADEDLCEVFQDFAKRCGVDIESEEYRNKADKLFPMIKDMEKKPYTEHVDEEREVYNSLFRTGGPVFNPDDNHYEWDPDGLDYGSCEPYSNPNASIMEEYDDFDF